MGYPGVPTMVPSVGPEGLVAVPQGLESPLYGDCPTGNCPTGAAAMTRLSHCGKWYTGAEYLMWWTKAADLPPLVTTSSAPFSGQLGRGDTTTLVGGAFGQTFHSGGRFTLGRWFDDSECRGVEGRLFFLGRTNSSYTATTDQFGLLARPFNNVNPGTPNFGSSSEVIADSMRAFGGVNVQSQTTVWGAEANYRRHLLGSDWWRLDGIVGYRYMNIVEKLTITENFTGTGVLPPGSGFPVASGMVFDSFRTENHFNGGQIGLVAHAQRGRWTLDGRAVVAFGNLSRTANISGGQSLILPNGTTMNAVGGLLALPGANIGRFNDNVFAVMPEAGLNIGYQVTSRTRVFVGYNLLYLGNALRPGDTIDTSVDPARVPNFLTTPANPIMGTPRPRPMARSSDFFIQGINFGLQFNW